MVKISSPIVVDLGKARKKHTKELRGGQGKLAAEVAETMKQVQANIGNAADGKKLVPVVVIYREKVKKISFPGMK